jgi:hypothetical protein
VTAPTARRALRTLEAEELAAKTEPGVWMRVEADEAHWREIADRRGTLGKTENQEVRIKTDRAARAHASHHWAATVATGLRREAERCRQKAGAVALSALADGQSVSRGWAGWFAVCAVAAEDNARIMDEEAACAARAVEAVGQLDASPTFAGKLARRLSVET